MNMKRKMIGTHQFHTQGIEDYVGKNPMMKDDMYYSD